MKQIHTYIYRLLTLALLVLSLNTICWANQNPTWQGKELLPVCTNNPTFSGTLRQLARPSAYSVSPAVNGGVSLSNGATVVINKGVAVGVRIPTLTKTKTHREIELELRQTSARIQGNTLLLSNKVQSIGVIDMTGRTVLAASNSNRLTLDLPQGTYILRYESNDSRVTNRLIML